jgi:hypothetical protein
MHAPLRAPSLLFLSAVAVLLPTASSAQIGGAVQPLLMRSSYSVVRPYVEQRDPLHAMAALPANMIVADVFLPMVESMRSRSAAFRRQCARIAGARHLVVVIERELPSSTRRPPALTRISRHQHGGMRATVRVTPSYRTPELIAHELEHVLEQLDGIDLPAKARLAGSGVRQCDCGGEAVFETARAIAAGQRVALELERN